jgi:hypothetical protein
MPLASSDDDDDAEAEADMELNRKVATVLQPIMKKMKKQAKRIEALEEELAQTRAQQDSRLPALEERVQSVAQDLADGLERTRRALGERVLHADHARVEVVLRRSPRRACRPDWTRWTVLAKEQQRRSRSELRHCARR